MKIGDLVQVDFWNLRSPMIGLIVDPEVQPAVGYRKDIDIWTVCLCLAQTTDFIDESQVQVQQFLSQALTVIS